MFRIKQIHPDTDENVPLKEGWEEDLLGNKNKNKKHHLEEGRLKKKGSQILVLTVCTRGYLSITNEPRMQPIKMTLDMKASDCILVAGTSHSTMKMES